MDKSRREKRNEARQDKKHKKHESWLQNQKLQKSKRTFGDSRSKNVNNSKKPLTQTKQERGFLQRNDKPRNQSSEISNTQKKVEVRDSRALKMGRGNKKGLKRNSKTKFEEFLEMDMQKVFPSVSAEDDLELERKLAKKLKVKGGKLSGADDGINFLFEGISSDHDSFEEGEVLDNEGFPVENSSSRKKRKKPESESGGAEVALEEVPAKGPSRKRRRKKKKSQKEQEGDTVDDLSMPMETHDAEEASKEAPAPASAKALASGSSVKYVAPHLRARAGNESEEHTQIRRRVRGLLNRLSESNVESVTGEMSTIFRSVGRTVGTQIISQEVLASCSSGPRGNEQYAAVFAAFVAGMACSVGMDFSAKLMALIAKSFEDEYLKEDDLSLRNITLLLSYLCIFGVFSSDLIYDFLIMLSKRLTEIDVSTILTVLQCCGMKIRGDDPAAMKNFILSIQNRVNELKASGDGQANINSKRMEFMLETICDIKNNKRRPKEDTAQHTRIKKWLQKLRAEDILIRGLKWSKLLDPDKKGQWWLSGDVAATTDNVEEIASTIDKEVLEAQKMLQLAAAQRMNTDIRKAIFCIIMSGEDYIDAFEKLLRLDLQGQQDREIMRVLMECCLQEKVFNKYYSVLASKLCEHDKNHKFTLQFTRFHVNWLFPKLKPCIDSSTRDIHNVEWHGSRSLAHAPANPYYLPVGKRRQGQLFCLWDHFKELETMQLLRSMHLAKFVSEMFASFTLSLAVLKTIDWSDPRQLTPKRIMHFRMLFEAIFEYPEKLIWNIFSRLAVIPELETLQNGIEFFIKEYVVRTNKTLDKKFKLAKKALKNAEGILM